jgi:hypothetical protein
MTVYLIVLIVSIRAVHDPQKLQQDREGFDRMLAGVWRPPPRRDRSGACPGE